MECMEEGQDKSCGGSGRARAKPQAKVEDTWKPHFVSDILERWNHFGKKQGLTTDVEIATFLLDWFEGHREETQFDKYCSCCHARLRLICYSCVSSTVSQTSDVKKRGSIDLSSVFIDGSNIKQKPFLKDDRDFEDAGVAVETTTAHNDSSVNSCSGAHTLQKHTREAELNKGQDIFSGLSSNRNLDNRQTGDIGSAPVCHIMCGEDFSQRGPVDSRVSQGQDPLVDFQDTLEKHLHCPHSIKSDSVVNAERGVKETNLPLPVSPTDTASRNSSVGKRKYVKHALKVQTARVPGKSQQGAFKMLKCRLCCAVFTSPVLLKKHKAAHGGDKPFKCQVCDTGFMTSSHLKVHLRCHTGDKPYQCKQCGLCCTQSGELVRHLLTHTGERPFHCTVCSAAFTRAAYLTVHMRNHHTGHKPHRCHHCGMAYADARNLKVHLRKHTGEKPFLCQECGKSFADPCVLARHRRQHTGAKPYRCVDCGASFTNSGSLKYHMRRHQGLKPYLCHECGMAFTSSSQLSQHRRTHTGAKPFTCEECGATFARSQNLKAHMLNHSGQKPQRRLKNYTCEHCSAIFTDNRNFVRHVRIHTGEKPFRCEQCEASFAQPGDLKKHIRIHTGEKPYTCSQCGSKFRHSSGLTIHVRTHTGEKPYQCTECDSAFISSSKLTAHVRSRHKSVHFNV